MPSEDLDELEEMHRIAGTPSERMERVPPETARKMKREMTAA
jgi:hypothetical protein